MNTDLARWGETNWQSTLFDRHTAKPCPVCGRHIRFVAVRYRETRKPTIVAYYMRCPNACLYLPDSTVFASLREDDGDGVLQKPLYVVQADDERKRLNCGRTDDVQAAVAAWNKWVEKHSDATPDGMGETWKEAVECPVCHKEYVETETFQLNGLEYLGCPEHHTIASIRAGRTTFRGKNEDMSVLKTKAASWDQWIREHHCVNCGMDARLKVDENGLWHCECLCDNPDTCPPRVPCLIGGAAETGDDYWDESDHEHGFDAPLPAINAWRKRVAERSRVMRRVELRRTRNNRLLDDIMSELSQTKTKED